MADWSDPRAEQVSLWLADFGRLIKATRLYADNNDSLVRVLSTCTEALKQLLTESPELVLSVREQHIRFGKDEVYSNADREESIAFILYRNAFRRLTFLDGIEASEVLALARAIGADTGGYVDGSEDLITVLWRLSLPHLHYLTIDALTVAASSSDLKPEEREEVERIQGSVEDIVAAIYKTGADDDDIVAGVSISKEDLEALKEIRKEDEEDLDLLDQATARALTEVPVQALEQIRQELENEDREDLVTRLVDILIEILFKEKSGRSAKITIDVVQKLFDSMILGRRFSSAAQLVEGLRVHATDTENMQTMHVARQLLRVFSSEARVTPVLDSLDDRSSSVQDKVRFLRSLGPDTRPVLLDALENLNLPGHRRLVCDLVKEFGVPSVQELRQRMDGTNWFVVRDLLNLAQEYPLQAISALIAFALNHEHPKVRQHAVGLLRGYGRGLADKLLAERLTDEDLEVRLAAVRVAAARKSVECKSHLEKILSAPDFFEREPREVKIITAAYAALVGAGAVPVLDKILNPGLLSQLRHTEAQVAAAFALASVGSPARDALLRGSRTFNTRVREACKKALEQKERGEGTEAAGALKIPDAASSGKIEIPPAVTTDSLNPKSTTQDFAPGVPEAETFVGASPSALRTSLEDGPDFSMEMPAIEEAQVVVGRKRPVVKQVIGKGTTDILPDRLRAIPEGKTTRDILPPMPTRGSIPLDAASLTPIADNSLPPEEPTQVAAVPKRAPEPLTSSADLLSPAGLREPTLGATPARVPESSTDIGAPPLVQTPPPPSPATASPPPSASAALRGPPPSASAALRGPPPSASAALRGPPPASASSDIMPGNLPPAPTGDLRPQGVPPAASSTADVMPGNLPPAPTGPAFVPPERPKDPKADAVRSVEDDLKAYLTDDLFMDPKEES